MKIKNPKSLVFLKLPLLGLLACVLSAQVYSANPENVAANVEFVIPITIVEVNALEFGLIDEALNTETITIATNDGVTGTGVALVAGGTPAAAEVTIGATVAQAASILIDTIIDGTGYSLGTFTCDYNTAAVTGTCSGSSLAIASTVASATLLIGATLTGDNNASVGPANGSFNVTMTYD
jgi:hypothetical protein